MPSTSPTQIIKANAIGNTMAADHRNIINIVCAINSDTGVFQVQYIGICDIACAQRKALYHIIATNQAIAGRNAYRISCGDCFYKIVTVFTETADKRICTVLTIKTVIASTAQSIVLIDACYRNLSVNISPCLVQQFQVAAGGFTCR